MARTPCGTEHCLGSLNQEPCILSQSEASKGVGAGCKSAGNRNQGKIRILRMAQTGRFAMQSHSQVACTALPAAASHSGHSLKAADRTYQAVTVAAALLLLGSL